MVLFLAQSEGTSPFVIAFDEIINGPLRQFNEASEKIGDDVKKIVSGNI